MAQSLAVKYRPTTFNSIVEQENIKIILRQQLKSGEVKNAYLFVGGAGTGKTTTARIFAHEVNKGLGMPVEMDAASNNGVDDVRGIILDAKTKSLTSEYKVFIIDECHSLSNSAWQALLKLIEEPPAKSIFIFCTTEAQKVPKTILSRVQRFDFHRISQDGIVSRLKDVLASEGIEGADDEALEYIAKLADGHLRDSLTMLDKCLAYSKKLTVENVVNALGAVDYQVMMNLTNEIHKRDVNGFVSIIDSIYQSGKDIKQFVRQYLDFILDVNCYAVGCDFSLLSIPKTAEITDWLNNESVALFEQLTVYDLLGTLVKLNRDIKYSQSPKNDLKAALVLDFSREVDY